MNGMTPEPENEPELFRTLISAGWILLALLVGAGWLFISRRFAAGIVCGGFLALGNSLWLKRGIEQSMGLEPQQAGRSAVARYLLRLALLAGLLYLLIVFVGIDILDRKSVV